MKLFLLKIKWEVISIILNIPYSIMQEIKAHNDFKLVAVILIFTIALGVYLTIYYSRKEALAEVRRLHIEEELQRAYKEAIKKEELKAQQKHDQMFKMLESL